MDALRTPGDRFENLPGWPYAPRYVEVDGLRMHYVDEGPAGAAPIAWQRFSQDVPQLPVGIKDAGHFLQEDNGEELAQVVAAFVASRS